MMNKEKRLQLWNIIFSCGCCVVDNLPDGRGSLSIRPCQDHMSAPSHVGRLVQIFFAAEEKSAATEENANEG